MSDSKRARLKQWLESGEARLHPLTFPQRELWEASAVPVADPANHICCVIKIQGALTESDYVSAVRHVVERQEVLRLSFLPGKEGPLQMVRRTGEPSLRFRELSGARAETVEELTQETFLQPFDLVQGPLYRIGIVRTSAHEHVMATAIHHSIADGWTFGVFLRDLCGSYLHAMLGEKEPIPAVPLSYTAWGAAERAVWTPAEMEKRSAWWKKALSGTGRLWNSAETSPRLERTVVTLSAEVAKAARELTRRHGVTLYSTLLTAFQIALARFTGKSDFIIGTPVANRGKAAAQETMGSFSSNVPVRAQVDSARPFADSLRAVHGSAMDSFAHAMPFAELAQAVGEAPAPGYHPVYQVRFALQNHPVPDMSVPGFSAQLRMRSTGTSRFDLGCEITEHGEMMEVIWLYRLAQFSLPQIQELDRLFQMTLAEA